MTWPWPGAVTLRALVTSRQIARQFSFRVECHAEGLLLTLGMDRGNGGCQDWPLHWTK